MYELLKDLVLDLLRCPKAPPDPPAGSHDSVRIFRAAPAYLHYRLLGLWIGLTFFVLVVLGADAALVLWLGLPGALLGILILGFVAAKGLFFYIVTRLDYEMRFYIITDRSLRIREGVWQIRETTLTFENIQNMKIQQGPLQRLFAIHDLVVETAGGGGGISPQERGHSGMMHRGVFRGIGRPADLRDLIMRYLKAVRTSGLGDLDDVRTPFALGELRSAAPHPGDVIPAPVQSASIAAGLFGPHEIAMLRKIRDQAAAWRKEVCPPLAKDQPSRGV
ncbi:MAG TPA: PH domain-containing protein [Sumerlaeia bacterium]|nr:PH domain-containing protein [Sumerlaeia bacterium]